MKRSSIRTHLRPYSIYGRRVTTIHHAFASAIASSEEYDDERVTDALRSLGQNPDHDLKCVYCGNQPAETWDHIHGLVINKRYSGYGHTIGNLLPCCRNCNSSKGNRNWQEFLRTAITNNKLYNERVELIQSFLEKYQQPRLDEVDIENICPDEMERLQAIHDQILVLMREADETAARVRHSVQAHVRTLEKTK